MLVSELFIKYLLAALAVQYREQGLERTARLVDSSYDFVVVGGGVAGLVVASRLTENANVKVLVLESGGSGSNYSDIPLLATSTIDVKRSVLAKYYRSVPSKACDNGPCRLLVGNVLGGGSTHNEMGVFRGNRLDFDEWAANGAIGWSYDDVLPYFKKFEAAEPGLGSDKWRGRSGPVKVQENNGQKFEFRDLAGRWLAAAKALNYPIGDYNGQVQKVFAPIQVAVADGRRQSSDNAYIRPFEGTRKNLNIVTFAFVRKVLFDGDKAIGVEYSRFNRTFRVFASKEVILSAGALRTPQILMVSGVGPRDQLEQFKIPIVKELSGVGQGLQDHPSAYLLYSFSSNYSRPSEEQYCRWLKDGSGIFGSSYGLGIGFVGSNRSKSPDDTQARLWLNIDYSKDGFNVFSLTVIPVNPRSRGSIRLNSSNIEEDPIVDPNYFAHDEDKLDAFQGLEIGQKMMSAVPFKEIRTKLTGSNLSGATSVECSKFLLGSKAYLACQAGKQITSEHHFCCTCKMGKGGDPMVVVDIRLRVLGLKNLRIIDASVMPSITRANTMASTYMIAEKGADMVKQDWKL